MATADRSTPPASERATSEGGLVGEAALGRVLDPVGWEVFLADFWEHRPLVVQRGEEGRFDDLLSTGDVERLVCSTGIRHPAFRLVKEGGQIPLRDYAEDIPWQPAPFTDTVRVERVLAEWEAGATIVLQALHLNWTPLAAFCRELERELGEPVQANAYYTPRDSQGFAVHHDTHDVIVLQVSGEKRWLVYDPALELPLRAQRYSSKLGPPGAPVEDLTLRAGDTLYLPRGWLHEALTSATDSLHITVGINVHTWLDAFKLALETCADEIDFRRSVPENGEGARGLLEGLGRRLGAEDVVARRRRKLVAGRRPVLDGQVAQLRALADLDLATSLERRPTVIADLFARDGRVVLAYEGKEVSLPAHARPELEYAAEAAGPFRARELPGELDEAGRLVLVRRLVREGFLRISEPRSGGDSEP